MNNLATQQMRVEFETAAKAKGLNITRDPEWYMYDTHTEEDRPYFLGRTDTAWWGWKTGVEEERKRLATRAPDAILFYNALD